jgi:hypothetical protein
MAKKDDEKKLDKIGGLEKTRRIIDPQAIKGVEQIDATHSVGATQAVGSARKRRPTRLMDLADREELLKIVEEEANKIFAAGTLPESKRSLVTEAVKMALDSGLLDESADLPKDDTIKKPKGK